MTDSWDSLESQEQLPEVFYKKLHTIHRKTAEPEPLFYNVPSLTLQLYLKRDPGTYVYCEFRKIFKNIFFYRTPDGDCF